jgi:ATP-binding cassette subfamily B protein/ATP-binding cassette subfamily C protein
MIAVNWKMTLVLTAVLIVFVFIILNLVVNKNKIQGQKRTKMGQKLSRIIGESFGNFKFIKLKCNEDHITENFDTTIKMLTRSQVVNQTLGAMPRNILESIGFSLLVAVVVFIMIKYQSAERVIPIIAMYALAMYRILPSITKMINNVSQIAYCQNSLDVVYENLYQPVEEYNDFPIDFKKSIQIKNISFSYLSGSNVLENISLEIRKGDKIAFTGESGSGKSTLVDIIIGINQPNSGTVYIDESPLTENNIRSWRKKIGYIPQTIYLFDGTVADNVSFGSDSNDEEIIKALKMAKIWDLLLTKEGLKTVVGEGGIQLSGGQKQRIGIARALYCNPEVLVLDEATSALDNDTESKIMDEIYQVSEDKTLIVISHRLSTVERCEKVITMNCGRIV